MRTFFFSLLFALAAVSAGAQNRQEDFENRQPDSVKYYLAEFAPGRIVYKNGEYSTGKLNISTVDQTVRFISEDGEALALNDNDQVDRVTVGPYLFLRNGKEFAALVDMAGEVSLCMTRKVVFQRDVKKGAFGLTSETTNISSVSSASGVGVMHAFNTEAPFTVEEVPWIYRKGVFYPASKKAFQRAFPDRKEALQAYIAENKVDFNDFEDVQALFAALK